MSISSIENQTLTVPPPSGYVIGFVDTLDQCQEISNALTRCGVAFERIKLLRGDSGAEMFHQMMQGYSWGEESEQMLTVGERELASGHFVLYVEAKERDEGMQIARVAQSQGGHGFRHFGELTDERLTA